MNTTRGLYVYDMFMLDSLHRAALTWAPPSYLAQWTQFFIDRDDIPG